MIFDGQVNLIDVTVTGPEAQEGEEVSADTPVMVTLLLGLNLPMPVNQGGQKGMALVPIPAMRLIGQMSGTRAKALADELAEAAESIPEQPKESPLVASKADMDQAIAAQKITEKMKQG